MAILNSNLAAAFLALLASAILSFSDNFVAALSEISGLWQFQVVRTLFAVPMIVIVAMLFGISLRPRQPGALILRSVTVAGALLVYFATLGLLPVSQAGAGLFSAPIWVMLFSVTGLGKRIGRRRVVAMAAGFIGVLLLLQPDLSNLTALSVLPLLAGALYGLGALFTKHFCEAESAPVLALGVFVTMGLASLGLLSFFTLYPLPVEQQQFFSRGWEGISAQFLILTFGQAVGATVAVSVIAQAYRAGETDFVAVCEYSFLVFAAVWSFVLWGQTTDFLAQIGIVTILISGTVMFILDRNAASRDRQIR
ncbi:EamA-like transporter family protein [Epibacterium ulvae]|uniref:EamA-like transporter family protein n=1 Tax=Epibacterium ulvae TaxID=1156985 RepID=A0A1G5QFB9_9RHOB|nr:DMT family transporter [Epibacterium ulvae]SCZ60565.1 EamA-like transporter family protein [Epibacterium ulvae]